MQNKNHQEDEVLIKYRELSYKDYLQKKDEMKKCECSIFCCCKMTYKAIVKLCEGDSDDTLENISTINESCICWKYIKGKINFIITFSIIALIIDIFSLYLSFILKPKNEYLKTNYFRKLDDHFDDFIENYEIGDFEGFLDSSTIQPKKKYFSEISNYQIGISFTNIIFTIALLILVFMQKCKYNAIIIKTEKKQGRMTEKFILIYFIFYVVSFFLLFFSFYTFIFSSIVFYSIKNYRVKIENFIISDYALVIILITLLLGINVILHFLISRRFEDIIVLLLDLNIKEENVLDNDADNKEKSGYLYIEGINLSVQIKYNSNIFRRA